MKGPSSRFYSGTERWLRTPAAPLLAIVASIGAALAVRFWVPSEGFGTTICPFRRCFDLSCPGCGMTRAMSNLIKGNWQRATEFHPLAPILLIQAVAGAVVWGASAAGWIRSNPRKWVDWVLIADLVALLTVWVVRLVAGTLPPA